MRRQESQPRDPSAGPRVAALHGWDIEHGGPPCDPAALLAEGYTLLALDARAIAICLRDSYSFTTVEDWFSQTGRTTMNLDAAAESIHDGWWQHDPEMLTTGSVVWPERDHWKEPRVWVIAVTVVRLAAALRAAGVSEVRLIDGHPFDILAPDRCPSRLTSAIFLRLLPGVAHPLDLPTPPLFQRFRQHVSVTRIGSALRAIRGARELQRFRAAAGPLLQKLDPERLTLLMLSSRELDRSGPIVTRLADHLREALVVVPWEESASITSLAGGLNDVPWLPTPPLTRGDRRTESRFQRGVSQNLAAHDLGELEPVRADLVEELCRFANRWAAYSARLTQTIGLLQMLDPALIVVGRDDVRYQIPGEAAAHLEIPVLSLPHSVVEWSPPERLRTNDRSIHLGGIENPTAPPGAILRCSETFVVYQYPRRVKALGLGGRDPRGMTVLALTDNFAGENWPSPGLRAHENALQCLASAARRVGPNVRVLLKPHPGTAEVDRLIVEALGLSTITVLPRTADLVEALAASDVVIGVNTVSSALVHALNAGLPVLMLMVGPWARVEDNLRSARPWLAFWDQAVPTFSSEERLISALSRLQSDAEFRRRLSERSLDLASMLTPRTTTPTVAEVVDGLLLAGATRRRARQPGPPGGRRHATPQRPTRR